MSLLSPATLCLGELQCLLSPWPSATEAEVRSGYTMLKTTPRVFDSEKKFLPAGQTGSPSSNQDSETVAYMLPRQSDRPADIQRAQTCSFVAETSTQNAKQPITLGGANSLPNPTDGAFPPPKIGHTVSTGISLPRISQQANKQVKICGNSKSFPNKLLSRPLVL